MLVLRRLVCSPVRRALCSSSAAKYAPATQLIDAEAMPLPLRRRVAALEALHARFETLEEEHHEKIREIERSFIEASSELFDRRSEIVGGLNEPTDEEVNASAYFAEFEEELDPTEEADRVKAVGDVRGVPAFWPTVLRQCESLNELDGFEISDADWAVLAHLVDVRSRVWDEMSTLSGDDGPLEGGWEAVVGDEPGYSLHFTFASSAPGLQSTELAVYVNGNGEIEQVDAPTWSEEAADPTVRWVTKKVKRSGKAPTKTRVAKPASSFFRLFTDPAEYEADDDDADDTGGALSPSQLAEEMAMRLREDAIPRAAIHYITALHGIDMSDDGFDLEVRVRARCACRVRRPPRRPRAALRVSAYAGVAHASRRLALSALPRSSRAVSGGGRMAIGRSRGHRLEADERSCRPRVRLLACGLKQRESATECRRACMHVDWQFVKHDPVVGSSSRWPLWRGARKSQVNEATYVRVLVCMRCMRPMREPEREAPGTAQCRRRTQVSSI